METEHPPDSAAGPAFRAAVGGTVLWWLWLLGVLTLTAAYGPAIVLSDFALALILGMGKSESEWTSVLRTSPGSAIVGLVFAAILVLLGWLGGWTARRLGLVPRRWWAPFLVAAAFWFLTISVSRSSAYVAEVMPYGHLGFYHGPPGNVLAGVYDRRFAQLLLEESALLVGCTALLCGHYLAIRKRTAKRTQAASVARSHEVPGGRSQIVDAFEVTAVLPVAGSAGAPHAAQPLATARRTAGLWETIDRDRLLSPRNVGILGAVLLVLLIGRSILSGGLQGTDWAVLVFAVAVALGTFAIFAMFAKRPNGRLDLSVSAAGIDVLDATQAALDTVMLATGERMPELRLLGSLGANAHIAGGSADASIAVSTAFAAMPRDEQEAGLALLLGRSRVLRQGPWVQVVPEGHRPGVSEVPSVELWLEAAKRGDREGLLILKDPQPILRLLGRLAESDTRVPGAQVSEASLFGYLAWPMPFERSTARPELARHAAISEIVEAMRHTRTQ